MVGDSGSAPRRPNYPGVANAPPSGESSRRAPWHWGRGLAAMAGFALACGAYMALAMTPNTSWEHHPYAGPLVALHEASRPVDFAVAVAVWVCLSAGLCAPAFRVTALSVLTCLASAGAWVALGIWAAGAASC